MSQVTSPYRDRFRKFAQHEMGHYVVARHFGFRTGDVCLRVLTFEAHEGSAAIEPHKALRTIGELEDHLLRRMAILYAGALSEGLAPGAAVKEVTLDDQAAAVAIINDRTSGAHSDHGKVIELRALLRNLRFPDTDPSDATAITAELDQIDKEVWGMAIAAINQHYMTIVGLASLMTARLTEMKQQVVMTEAELDANPAVAAIQPV